MVSFPRDVKMTSRGCCLQEVDICGSVETFLEVLGNGLAVLGRRFHSMGWISAEWSKLEQRGDEQIYDWNIGDGMS